MRRLPTLLAHGRETRGKHAADIGYETRWFLAAVAARIDTQGVTSSECLLLLQRIEWSTDAHQKGMPCQ